MALFFFPEEVLTCRLESSSFFPNSLFPSGPINLESFAEQPYSFSKKQTASLFSLLCPSSPNLQQLRVNLVVRDWAGAADLNPLTLRRLLNHSQLTSFWVTALTTDIKDEQQHHHHPSLKNRVIQLSSPQGTKHLWVRGFCWMWMWVTS